MSGAARVTVSAAVAFGLVMLGLAIGGCGSSPTKPVVDPASGGGGSGGGGGGTTTHEIRLVEMAGGYITNICTSQTNGDRDFGGHGPRVRIWAREELHNNREVWCVVHFEATETVADWTTGVGDYTFRMYTVPAGWHFKEFASDHESYAEYVDTNHDVDAPPIQDAGFMWRVWVVGDTAGDDVGNCTADDTRIVRLDYNPVMLRIEAD